LNYTMYRLSTTTSQKHTVWPAVSGSRYTQWCCGECWRTSRRALREGPLAAPKVLALLHDSFVSSWALVTELKSHAGNTILPGVSMIASLSLDAYTFPVQILIQEASGYVVAAINANQVLDAELNDTMIQQGFHDPAEFVYYKFLEEGLKKYRDIFID
ncbi:Selenoprotein N-like 1, partial [Homarus americanus]